MADDRFRKQGNFKHSKPERGTNMSSLTQSHRSRFGFHPCSYQDYQKLKYLHRRYWETLRRFHQWHRWNQKLAENRIGAEPEFCEVFVENRPWAKPILRHGEPGFKRYSKTVIDHGVIQLYQQSRMPSEEPVTVFSKETLEEIDRLYGKTVEYSDQEAS